MSEWWLWFLVSFGAGLTTFVVAAGLGYRHGFRKAAILTVKLLEEREKKEELRRLLTAKTEGK